MDTNYFTSVYFDILPDADHKALLETVSTYATKFAIDCDVVIESVGLTYIIMRGSPPLSAVVHLQALSTLTGIQFDISHMGFHPEDGSDAN